MPTELTGIMGSASYDPLKNAFKSDLITTKLGNFGQIAPIGQLTNSFNIGSNAGLGINQALNTAANGGGEATKGLDWFGNNGVIGSTASLLGSGAQIWNAYNSWKYGKAQVEEMKKQNELLAKQYEEETKRYNKREAERDASNSYFQNMAGNIWEKYYSNYASTNDTAQNATQTPTQEVAQTQEQEKKHLSPVERE